MKKTVSLLSHSDVQARLAWLEAQQPAPAQTFRLTSGWRSNMSGTEYAEKFARVQAYLQSGDCYQVNLAQGFQATQLALDVEDHLVEGWRVGLGDLDQLVEVAAGEELEDRFLQLVGGRHEAAHLAWLDGGQAQAQAPTSAQTIQPILPTPATPTDEARR